MTKYALWFNILNVMAKKTIVLLPKTQKILEKVGEQIKLARLRRKLSSELVAERANISRATLWSIEKGEPSVAIGNYAAVLLALGFQEDLLFLAKDDILGRTYQDMNLLIRQRSPKQKTKNEVQDAK